MKKKILNLSDIKTNDILEVTQKGKPPCYCIVHSCTHHKDIGTLWGYLSDAKKKAINAINNRTLRMVEFDKQGSSWDMTVPVRTKDNFVSLLDKEYEFTLHTATIEEVQEHLKRAESTEFGDLIEKMITEKRSIERTYAGIINGTTKKLLKPFKS